MSNERDRIREEIREYLKLHTREGDCPCAEHQEQMARMARGILNIKGLLIEADNQELPELPPWAIHEIIKDACLRGQQSLVEANFKRVIKEE